MEKLKLNPIPKRIRCGLDSSNTSIVQDKMDNFFIETRNYLEYKYGKSPHFEIKYKNMEQSDNVLTYLLYKDTCVAGVFERRTETNNLEYIFFRNMTQLRKPSKRNNNH
jgi:hypothetical protein